MADQNIAVDAIIESMKNNSSQLICWDAPSETAKTFLANLVFANILSIFGVLKLQHYTYIFKLVTNLRVFVYF